MPPRRIAGSDAEAELPEYAGQYRLESRLGSGGMGVVHLARSASGLRLAVKVINAEFARDTEFRGRFKQEVAAARRVSGAFTAPVVDADPEADRPWMATLFIPGPTLAEHVKRNGSLSSAQLRQVMAGLAEALRDIHRAGVVHRDLKPSNVLLAEDGPKVIDFGISRPSDSELRTETGKLIGTPPFMAPEQFRRPREVGPAADIFALGSVLVHAATGRGPFDSDSPYVVAYQVVHDEPDLTDVPGDLAPLIARCLAKEPDERPTPDELMAELRHVSSLYDTQAFIPAQRAAEAAEVSAGAPAGSAEAVPDSRDRTTHVRGKLRTPAGSGGGGDAGSRDSASGADAGANADAGADAGAGAVSVRSRRRGLLTVVLGGVAVLAVGGALLAGLPGDDGSGRRPGSASGGARESAGEAFRPWVAKVGTGEGMAKCTYGGGALLCAGPGVLAGALGPRDGKVRWTRPAKSGEDVSVSAPVLSGGLVHTLTAAGGQLVALDPDTGRTRWKLNTSVYGGGAQYVGDTVLLTSGDGTVTGIDGKTGKRLWQGRPAGGAQPAFAYFGGELAYATTLTSDGTGTQVIAVDPRTGDVRWRHDLDGLLTPVGTRKGTLWLTAQNAYQETRSIVGYTPDSASGGASGSASDSASSRASGRASGGGKERRIPLDLPLPSTTAALHGDAVYLLAAGGALVAVDIEAGKQRWRRETSVSRASAPTADDRYVYVSAPDGRLLAADVRTGKLVGQTPTRLGEDGERVVAEVLPPMVVGDRVYASAPDGSVFGVDARRPADW
ncbi:PQQ-binding-like beta-propeller repeat protein [Streptomyces sp. BH-SS-21]|uniref:PQQ-binding-like beta-propeller repeat protein n=1 Tax=Streptomyces liliiviolaceus TaxID=2823109 RepID=A0A941B5V3_9ACTN|nr:serine/threonine-protein kinase [Streptomyces liliiviolaceus]MBQ0848277.1 PQQ-binding-like beta-propeller repeat protein [Streptomyces liliiviolaceus]